ncbi:PIN domain-containing protein [Sphingomonas sp. H39-1-10]|uniref:type II toxin-antitoxin system VapC family toxin n=1 Tax=Sphingomonas pollutisoli TaxID=3030829 RepID=UPI0023B9067A|nr:PIN domain-containing protein [Sphingomonas pollutisoli]MDF0490377.1 PIN domain-containing protein [Sphingomonas pollutisoli]
MKAQALLDSNVVIALLAESHEYHKPSIELLTDERRGDFAVAAHSYAESYSTLTRRGERGPFRFTAEEAWAALESVRAVTELVGLTPAQSFDVVRGYAQGGGIGARLYDLLIGEAAVVHEIPVIVTWNVGHMRSLFPDLKVATPKEFASTAGRR